jgi:hypothetical protein
MVITLIGIDAAQTTCVAGALVVTEEAAFATSGISFEDTVAVPGRTAASTD